MSYTIDLDGKILQAWYYENGDLIKDTNNPYNIEFFVTAPFNDEQKAQYKEIKRLKKYLRDTDYKALKYADGAYTEEEYAPVREQRAESRARINEIEAAFIHPTLTREQIDHAEAIAAKKIISIIEEQTGKEVEEILGEVNE